MINKKIKLFIIITLLTFLVTACGNNNGEEEVVFGEVIYPEIAVVDTHYLMDAETNKEVEIEWGAKEGTYTDEGVYEESKVEWKAPSSEDTVNISLKANDSTIQEEIKIKEPPVIAIDYNIYSEYGATYGEITFKNYSEKDITSLELIIIGWNDFNERIKTNYMSQEDFGHYKMNATASDINFEAGTESSNTWYIDLAFINTPTEIEAYITRVAYSDGTVWELE